MRINCRTTDDKGFYEPYVGFARALRTWFIAYGIGAPVLLIQSETCWTKLMNSGQALIPVFFFLTGVVIQILTAMVYKTAMWYLYMGELNEKMKLKIRYKISDWLSESYCVEFIIDFGTLCFFALATYMVISILLQIPNHVPQ